MDGTDDAEYRAIVVGRRKAEGLSTNSAKATASAADEAVEVQKRKGAVERNSRPPFGVLPAPRSKAVGKSEVSRGYKTTEMCCTRLYSANGWATRLECRYGATVPPASMGSRQLPGWLRLWMTMSFWT